MRAPSVSCAGAASHAMLSMTTRQWRLEAVAAAPAPVAQQRSSSARSLLGVAREARLQVALHVRPLRQHHAVHDRIPDGAVAPRPVVADDAVLLRAERLDRL